jgi:hypothetical protein
MADLLQYRQARWPSGLRRQTQVKSSLGQPSAHSGQETGGGSNPPLVIISFLFFSSHFFSCLGAGTKYSFLQESSV